MINYLKQNYFNFEGRASAREYWQVNLHIVLYGASAFLAFGFLESMSLRLRQTDLHLPITLYLGAAVFLLSSIALFLPLLALQVRRLHDLNLSGWWIVLPAGLGAALGTYSWIVSLGFFLFLLKKGSWGSNKFGPEDDFEPLQFFTPLHRIWHGGFAAKAGLTACLGALAYVSFFAPINGLLPKDRGDALTEYTLIDRKTDSTWALVLPSQKPVELPEATHAPWPSLGGRRPARTPNKSFTFDLNGAELGLAARQVQPFNVRLFAGNYDGRGLGRHERKKCRRSTEIAPGVYALTDVPKAEAELEYEQRAQSKSFDEYYAFWFADRCVTADRYVANRYVVTDALDQPIGYGFCRAKTDTCYFRFTSPGDTKISYDVDKQDVKQIQTLHRGVGTYLIAATDLEKTTGVTLTTPDAPEPEPFNPSTFVPTPSFSSVELDPNSIPAEGFKQVFFNRDAPNTVVEERTVKRIALNLGRARPAGIATDKVAGYWVGKRTFAKPTRQMLSLSVSNGLTMVRINGETVYQYMPRAITGADLQEGLDNPLLQIGDSKFFVLGGGPRPDNPFVVTFPAGESIIELEHINDFHVVDVALNISDEIQPLTRSAAQDRLTALNLQAPEVLYFSVYESSRPDGKITLRLPKTDRPVVLILDSHAPVAWEVDKKSNIAATLISSRSPATELLGDNHGTVIHLNKPFDNNDETRDCDCERGYFRCSSKTDVIDIADAIQELTGSPLTGYAMSYDIGLMKVTPYTKSVTDRINDLRKDYAALSKTCGS